MPRRLLLALIAMAVVSQLGLASTVAQEASPTPAPSSNRDILLQATIAELPTAEVNLELIRITLAPGAASPPHTHPGPEFGIIESGTLTVLVEAPALLLPAAGDTTEASATTPVGEEFTLERGDRIAWPAGTTLTFRNAGDEPVSLLAITVLPAGEEAPPGVAWAEGTPTAEDETGVTSERLGGAVVGDLPAGPVAVTLERLALSPGDQISGYPGPVLIAVEVGAINGSVVEGVVELDQPDAASAEANATPSAGFAVSEGEALFFPEGMSETPPLSGDGSLILLRLGIIELPESVTAPVEALPGIDVGGTVTVTNSDVNLRSAPSLEGEPIAALQQGQVLMVTGPAVQADGFVWLPVSDPTDPNLIGFVAADFLAP